MRLADYARGTQQQQVNINAPVLIFFVPSRGVYIYRPHESRIDRISTHKVVVGSARGPLLMIGICYYAHSVLSLYSLREKGKKMDILKEGYLFAVAPDKMDLPRSAIHYYTLV